MNIEDKQNAALDAHNSAKKLVEFLEREGECFENVSTFEFTNLAESVEGHLDVAHSCEAEADCDTGIRLAKNDLVNLHNEVIKLLRKKLTKGDRELLKDVLGCVAEIRGELSEVIIPWV